MGQLSQMPHAEAAEPKDRGPAVSGDNWVQVVGCRAGQLKNRGLQLERRLAHREPHCGRLTRQQVGRKIAVAERQVADDDRTGHGSARTLLQGGEPRRPDWIVDPELDVRRVYRRREERFDRPAELSLEAGDVLTTAVLPGLELPLSRIFAG